MDIRECYIKMQENCGIKIGDTVKVLRKAVLDELGWECSWLSLMDDHIGKEFTVSALEGSEGIRLDNGYLYPFFVLEKISSPVVLKHGDILLWEDGNESVVIQHESAVGGFYTISTRECGKRLIIGCGISLSVTELINTGAYKPTGRNMFCV